MDVNEYMRRSAEAQERSAAALERIAKQMGQQVAGTLALTSEVTSGAVAAIATAGAAAREENGAGKPAGTAAARGGTSPAGAAGSGASAGEAGNGVAAGTGTPGGARAVAGGSSSGGSDAKPLKIDDVRAALQAFAKRQGNPAAMELLARFGAKSVSAVPEDKWAELMGACK